MLPNHGRQEIWVLPRFPSGFYVWPYPGVVAQSQSLTGHQQLSQAVVTAWSTDNDTRGATHGQPGALRTAAHRTVVRSHIVPRSPGPAEQKQRQVLPSAARTSE